mmetsp:Transcript_6440/g.29048  ORF Transcript_6440/g.29048 Transcript_6440/m.29048 type:complete len:82 (-) Transcript_6440:183-428(-)
MRRDARGESSTQPAARDFFSRGRRRATFPVVVVKPHRGCPRVSGERRWDEAMSSRGDVSFLGHRTSRIMNAWRERCANFAY